MVWGRKREGMREGKRGFKDGMGKYNSHRALN